MRFFFRACGFFFLGDGAATGVSYA